MTRSDPPRKQTERTLLRRDQRRALLALSSDDVNAGLMSAYNAAWITYTSRAREVTFASANAQHNCDTAMQCKIVALYTKIEKAGSLHPLIAAIDKSEEAMKADPHKASNTIWSHALAGMSGSYLNLTLDRSRQR